jgi:outer membrane receptor protein involved in Fe transport
VGYQNLGDIQDIDQDFTPRSLVTVVQDQDQHLLTGEFTLRSPDKRRFEWVAGLHGFRQVSSRRVDVSYGDDGVIVYKLPAPQIKRKDYDFRNRGFAAFGQLTFKNLIIKGLDITVGIRADQETDRLVYSHHLLMNDTDTHLESFDHSEPFFEVLPKWSLQYRIGRSWMTYAAISKGYKSGGFNSTFEREEDQTFDSEFTWNYETGVKFKSRDNRVMASASVYYIDWKNQQIYQPVPSGQGSMLVNAGKTVSRGFELEGSANPFRNFVVNLAGGYTHARFTDYVANPAKGIDYTGNRVPYVPEYTWFAGASYRIPVGIRLLDEIRLSANMQGIGSIFWNDANAIEQTPYELLGARIELFYRNFSLAIWGTNLLNESYNIFLFQALGNTYAQPGQPRLVGMTLTSVF